MVTLQEVLEQLDLPTLKKIAKRLGIQVPKGITGYFIQQQFGIETRRPYINALSNSGLVTLEEIDRILKTHYTHMGEEDKESSSRFSERPQPRASRASERPESQVVKSTTLSSFESAYQFILERLTKDDLLDICHDLNRSLSGNKGDLVFRILGDPSFGPKMALHYANKETLKGICDELSVSTQGTREELASRIVRVVSNLPIAQPLHPATPLPQESSYTMPNPPLPPAPAPQLASQPAEPHQASQLAQPRPAEAEPPKEEAVEPPMSTPAPKPSLPRIDHLRAVVQFLESYRPTQRYRDEALYEVNVATAMEQHFGLHNVRTQRNIMGGRIDIEVLGVGVEIKNPRSKADLQRLEGQAYGYQRYYGPKLVVLIINDHVKYADVNESVNNLRDRGIQVFVM